MKTKNLIFVGIGLVIVGGITYFYLKSKNKSSLADTLSTNLENTGTGSISTNTGTGSSSTNTGSSNTAPINTPASLQEAGKQIQAQGLANQIVTLKSQFGSLQKPIPTCNAPQIGNGFSMIEYAKCNKNKTQILDIQNRIKELGYKEVNGIAVKL